MRTRARSRARWGGLLAAVASLMLAGVPPLLAPPPAFAQDTPPTSVGPVARATAETAPAEVTVRLAVRAQPEVTGRDASLPGRVTPAPTQAGPAADDMPLSPPPLWLAGVVLLTALAAAVGVRLARNP